MQSAVDVTEREDTAHVVSDQREFLAPERARHRHHPRRAGRWVARGVRAFGVSLALLLTLSTVAGADGGSVVPPNGKVAGEGYAYWLQRSWQTVFSGSLPMNPCQTLTANGEPVGYVTLPTIVPGTYDSTCSEPAGQPMYVIELSGECSTFPGDHGNFGTTDSQLKKCARTLYSGVVETTTVDGQPIDVSKSLKSTQPFSVNLASGNNILGLPPGEGRSAAYGYGLVLTGLPDGTHIIHTVGTFDTLTWDITWTVLVG
jgi:hypothetical protein